MDTAKVFFRFEVEKDADRDAIAQLLQERLDSLEIVQEAEATPDETKITGAEIVAGIAVGVIILRSGRELTEELRKLIQEVTELVKAIKGLKRALVDLGDDELVPTQQLSQEQLEKLAQEEDEEDEEDEE